uniref:Regulator of microtubule dynamics protein 1 n=1 Tax=Caenorhabditis japonica TaxID=281687 RepID=A0A8R1DZ74_CAEJA
MFKRVLHTAFRLQQRIPKAVAGGVGTSLGIALFAKKEQEKVDAEKPKNFDIIVRNVDELYDNYLIDNCYNILKKFENSTCSELLWRLARVTCEKGKLSKDPAEKKKYTFEAFGIIKRALESEPKAGSFGTHKWYAILLDYVGEIEGNKSRIEKSYEVKTHLERALQIFENDPTTWHILDCQMSHNLMGLFTEPAKKAKNSAKVRIC